MKTISVSKLKAHLSAELKRVRNGAELIITDHDQPIAVVKPFVVDDDLVLTPAKNPHAKIKINHGIKINFDPLEYLLEDRRRR